MSVIPKITDMIFPRSEGNYNSHKRQIPTKFSQYLVMDVTKIFSPDADFSLKMHQIQFRLELCPRPHWGAHSALQPSSWIWEKGRDRRKGCMTSS